MILSINTDDATIGRFRRFVLEENMRRSDEGQKNRKGKYIKLTNGAAINMLIDTWDAENAGYELPEYEPPEYDGEELI